jgi:chemotaxis protein CheC
MRLNQTEYDILFDTIKQGMKQASQGLSAMTGSAMQLTTPSMDFMPLNIVPNIAGGPDKVVVAIYLGIEGDLNGHVMLLFSAESATRMGDLLFGNPPGTTKDVDDMVISALAEAGNVCGSFCMNAISNRTGLKVVPTPPAVVTDMAGAILQAVVTELYLAGDEALVVETGFNGDITGHFLLMPDQNSMARLVAALESLG